MKLLAPNGKPSNLTPEQYKLVRTPEFKAWFGDWEKYPETASKVVDENGEPLVVYHGTIKDFSIFSFDKLGSGIKANLGYLGIYFTDDKTLATDFTRIKWTNPNSKFKKGSKVYEVFLKIKNPKYMTIDGFILMDNKNRSEESIKNVRKDLLKKGYDGIIVEKAQLYWQSKMREFDGKQYVILQNNKNIKLADGTNTTFDSNNPDIRFSLGGEIEQYKKQGVLELNFYPTNTKHAKEYGIDAKNPLYLQNLIVKESDRLKFIGKKVLRYLDEYAIKNGHDVIFGYVSEKATMTKDNRTGYFTEFKDVDWIKHWLFRNGYCVKRETNNFYKLLDSNNPDIRYKNGGQAFNDKELLSKWKRGESIGFTATSHLKAKGLIPRADGTKRKSDKYLADGGLIAPNGKPSKLTPEQYKLVRTPEFKAWFGDWENDPANASKVIDEETKEPLIVYHGTDKVFYKFDNKKTKRGVVGSGFYFTPNKNITQDYGKIVLSFFIKITSPLIIKNESYKDFYKLFGGEKKYYKSMEDSISIDEFEKNLSKQILSFGYNGVYDYISDEIVVFNPNQIKLADGTNTTFDSNNPDIRYDGGGLIKEIENENEGNLYYILNDNQVGYLDYYYDLNSSISEELNKFKSELYISYVEVDKKYRGKGIATKLIKKAIDIAKKMNIEIVSLRRDDGLGCNYGSNYDKYLKSIYEKLGFIEDNKDCGMILNLKKQYKKYEDGGLIAPNGKPSKLTPEQYRVVRTPAFKKWFGDWEENAKIQYGGFGYLNGYKTGRNSSLAIDENGEPKVFYHQTSIDNYKGLINSGIINFELEYGGGKSDKLLPFGFYLKPSSEDIFKEKKDYAQVPFFLNLRKIETFENRKDIIEHYERISRFSKFIKSEKLKFTDKTKITDYFKSREIDCVRIIKDFDSWEVNFTETFLVLDKNNIKLADGTNTTFDSNNPDIRYEIGGIFHGSPYYFDKFNTSKIGSGIGQQRDGWGIYLTDDKESAKNYGNYIYKTEIFKGKKLGEYTLIDLKKPVKKYLVSKIVEAYKDYNKHFNVNKLKELVEFSYSGYLFYRTLSRILGGDKEASLFLLKNGIDGLKSSFKNSSDVVYRNDYVIFDENAISIESKDYLPNNYYSNGGQLKDLLSSKEVEDKLGRELHWWNDDIVYLSGIKYKKVYLRPEYKKVIE